MLCSTRELDGLKLSARDGDVGHAREVLFDDRHWVIRHVVADTGAWLTGRKVLISPHSIAKVDLDARRLELTLTRDEIENAPGIDTDKPVSRQQEVSYYDYYGYPYWWAGPGLWGAAAYPLPAAGMLPRAEEDTTSREAAEAKREAADPHLRSSKEVTGYDTVATDGDIGHIEDFLFDARSWQIRYVVVDTRDWLPGRHVLVSPEWITGIEWNDRRVRFKVTREAVESSPQYQRGSVLSADQVRRVQGHYEGWV
jgi:hypothetical protein